MGAICAVVLAGVCIAAPYEHAVTLNALYTNPTTADAERPAAIERLGARIDIWLSDNLATKNKIGGRSVCGERGCVIYAAVCAPDGLECRYEWDSAPYDLGTGGTLTMHARSRADMERARKAVFVQTGILTEEWMSFASFKLDTARLLPQCGRDPASDCYNPYVGLWLAAPRQR